MFLTWIFLLITRAETDNVALLKHVYICTYGNTSVQAFDGDRYHPLEAITESCPDGEYLAELAGKHFIHSVVVFGGEILRNGKLLFDGSFTVNTISGITEKCGEYMKMKRIAPNGLRVNCESSQLATLAIIIKLKSMPFFLSEIEVHTLVSGIGIENFVIHRGCYQSFPSSTRTQFVDFDSCLRFCSSKVVSHLAVEENEMCHCGSDVYEVDQLAEKYCNIACTNSKRMCGGAGTFSVYLVYVQLPHYLGCVKGTFNNLVQGNDMTVARCLLLCDGSYYALLKNGQDCTCTNVSSKFSYVDSSFCNTLCAGDPNIYCGGLTYWSVYGTCFGRNNKTTLSCSKLLRCATSWDENGICEGHCKDGYVGEHCIERELKFERNENLCSLLSPCVNQSNSICEVSKITGSRRCHCIQGHWKFEESGICEDIDECQFGLCDYRSTTCENVPSSYKCNCKPGYIQMTSYACTQAYIRSRKQVAEDKCSHSNPCKNISNSFCKYDSQAASLQCLCNKGFWKNEIDNCEDIDECQFNPCENSSSTCENQVASYKCKCFEGFIALTDHVCQANSTVEHYGKVEAMTATVSVIACIIAFSFFSILLCFGRNIEPSSSSPFDSRSEAISLP